MLIDAHRNYTKTPDLNQFHMHTHDSYEIYSFISGSANYYVEGNIYNLKPGDILIIKKAEAHTLLINSNMPYERIVINFYPEALIEENLSEALSFLNNKPLGRNNRYSFEKNKNSFWQYYLDKICSSKDIYEQRIYLTVLLRELKNQYQENNEEDLKLDNTSSIIEYINIHLSEQLSLEKLSKVFYLSKSQINRRFKRMTGSTVWEYITTKRLILAKELLQKGEHPTNVYIKSGFADYCTFYRSYKSKFSVSPKTDFINPYKNKPHL